MYTDEDEKYVYPEDNAVKGVDYWYRVIDGQRVRVRRATGGGHYTDFGGPCGPLYTDRDGNM